MITFDRLVTAETEADHKVSLTFHQRVKRRLRVFTLDDVDVGIFTEGRQALQQGDK